MGPSMTANRYRGIADVRGELLDMAGDMQDLSEKYKGTPDLAKFYRAIADKLMVCCSRISRLGVH